MKVYAESVELVIPVSYESTEVIETGKWGFQKPETTFMTAPCAEACPAGNPIAEFIYLAGEGYTQEALKTILKENPFPGVCGRVCFHPCESGCNRSQYDEAVSINALERHMFDATVDLSPELTPAPNSDPKRMAIVGAGPAGLSCAYFLALLGHKVTLYEARKEPGGVLRWGIPEYRLPKRVLKKEIGRILGLGIEMKTGVEVGKDLSLEALSRFDAIFLSPGAGRNIPLGVKGEDLTKVWRGTDFLNRINSGERGKPGKEVVVIGGGNTAMDVARSARRLGSSVTIAYRRTKKEMPAISEEVEEAEQEGVRFEFLVQPVEIRLLKSKKIRIKFQRMKLRKMGQEERPRPVPIKDDFVMMEADRLITAVGEGVDLSWIPQTLTENGFLKAEFSPESGKPKIFAGGDAVDQQRSVVAAISSGKKSAIAIDLSFRGLDPEEVFSKIRVGSKGALSMEAYLKGRGNGVWEEPKGVVVYDQINTLYFRPSERVKAGRIDTNRALKGFSEVHAGFSSEGARLSALRCFSCGTCNYCYNCYFFCPEGIVSFDSENRIRKVDLEHCKGCGTCSRACPRHVIEMRLIS
jgi:NADPH-dependent glutamate synthase beta subunit-like oxidoreductase/Pyruvate/2-oxoacid:ferredoxin oxidoreductase delta subunit